MHLPLKRAPFKTSKEARSLLMTVTDNNYFVRESHAVIMFLSTWPLRQDMSLCYYFLHGIIKMLIQ